MKLTYGSISLLLMAFILGGCQADKPEATEDSPAQEESASEVQTANETSDITDDSIDPAIYEEQITKEGGLGDTLPVLEKLMGPDGEHDWNAKIDEVIAFHEKGEGSIHPILESEYEHAYVQADDKTVIFGFSYSLYSQDPLPKKDDILAHAKNHIPTDSKMTRETEMENGWAVFEFTSEAFKKRFPSEEGHFYIRAVTSEDETEYTSYAVLPGEFEE